MKNLIIYLGVALLAFTSVSLASNTNTIGNQKKLNIISESPSALVMAISKGEFETVKQFIESGTKINKKINGMTPLMYAARYNKAEILKYLLQKGANRDMVDSQGFTALKYAELSNAFEAIAILKSSPVNDNASFLMDYDTTFLNPESVLSVKSSRTIDEIITEEEKIIESNGFNDFQPLDFKEINKNSNLKNTINS